MTGAERTSFSASGFHTCTSPNRPGAPPTAASRLPSGEYASDCTRSEMPMSRACRL